jgi:signal transduction histidine kinase
MTRARHRLLYVGAVLWLLLTVTLAGWWMWFGLAQAQQLRALSAPEARRLEHVQRMIVWEGSTFIGLLVGGGIALVVSIRREQARQHAVEAFFMAFTHDLKTALASLQLQAESLSEDLPDAAANPNMTRLLKDTLRLGVQLENSLYFAQPEGHLLVEPVSIAKFIERTAADWPELNVRVEGDETVLADARALESVWRNLLQNAVIHGGARAAGGEVTHPASRCVWSEDDADDSAGGGRPVTGAHAGRAARKGTHGRGMGADDCRRQGTRGRARVGSRHPGRQAA